MDYDSAPHLFQIYRKTKFFEILEEIILVNAKKYRIPPEAIEMAMDSFDKIISQNFMTQKGMINEHKWQITGYNANINNIDSVWNFTLRNPKLQFGTKTINLDLLQVLCVDSDLNPYVGLTCEERAIRNLSMDVKKRKK